jgi:hypothetical protein
MNKREEKGKYFELVMPSKNSVWKDDDVTAALLVPTIETAPEPIKEEDKGISMKKW